MMNVGLGLVGGAVQNTRELHGAREVQKVREAYPVSNTRGVERTQKSDDDGFAVSSAAKDFQMIKAALSSIGDVRQDKVDDVKNRVDAGNYKVNAGQLADKIASAGLFF